MTPDPLSGQLFGQYELQERLGQGGMASVYRALQPALGRQVAVKVLSSVQLHDPTLPQRFRREARLAANLMHPNIVPVYDFGEWNAHLYIVMALVTGGTLKERTDGPLPLESAVRLVGQIADALGYAHGQGVVHRDVKPTNVLLGPGDWAMLSDFGIARALGETTRLTSPQGTVGTPAYMAPEQWLGDEIDGRADLYSLGILLFELLTGKPPFRATTAQGLMRQHLEAPVPSLRAARPELPAGVEGVIHTVLAKSAEERFRHAGEFKVALEHAAMAQTAIRPSSGTFVAPPSGRPFTPLSGVTTTRVTSHHPWESVGQAPQQVSKLPIAAVFVMAILILLLAASVGYIVATSQSGPPALPPAVATTQVTGDAQVGVPTLPPAPPTATQAAPTAAPVIVVITATPLPPTPVPPANPTPAPQPSPTPVPPTPTLAPPPPLPVTKPAAPALSAQATAASDPRLAVVERRVSDYFAALNAGDYARAQASCCTAGWRSRYPLAEWEKNFTGVRDLRFTTPFRYPAVSRDRIVAEVDYSFVNSSGARRNFTLRWTFVPIGGDWLADDASAFPR